VIGGCEQQAAGSSSGRRSVSAVGIGGRYRRSVSAVGIGGRYRRSAAEHSVVEAADSFAGARS
jgi:hypothetical protein